MSNKTLLYWAIAALAAACGSATAGDTTVPTYLLQVKSLDSAIAEAKKDPTRFATGHPVEISTASHGTWVHEADRSVWKLTLAGSKATTMGFHAKTYKLPMGSELITTGDHDVRVRRYDENDVTSSGFWSMTQTGDTINLALSVPAGTANDVLIVIDKVFLGFIARSNQDMDDAALPSLPGERTPMSGVNPPKGADPAGDGTSEDSKGLDCGRVNFTCYDSGDDIRGRSTVYLEINGESSCTGTLINNTSNNGRPLILTAGHCSAKQKDGSGNVVRGANGLPLTIDDVTGIRTYFRERTPCRMKLGRADSGDLPTVMGKGNRLAFSQFGLNSEDDVKLDYMLFELASSPPAGSRAIMSGWDATVRTVANGLAPPPNTTTAVNHGSSIDQQLNTAQNIGEGTSKSSGQWAIQFHGRGISSGASGGALFDNNTRIIGTLSDADQDIGTATVDAGGGSCQTPKQYETGRVGSAYYPKMHIAFDNTQLGATPLKTFLDPTNTGNRTALSFTPPSPPSIDSFTLTPSSVVSGNSTTAAWTTSTDTTSCTSSAAPQGSVPSWSGAQAISGSLSVATTAAGSVAMTLTCSNANGSASLTRTLTVTSAAPPPAPTSGGGLTSKGGALLPLQCLALLFALLMKMFSPSARLVGTRR